MVRASGHYPLLGGGDVNLYSLFVERAMELIKPDGLVGLLTPSGIYADKTAADFFKSVSTAGRVAGLFDFENKKIFFKDVHASFKFCALIFGGEKRRFDKTECAFFLHDTETLQGPGTMLPAGAVRLRQGEPQHRPRLPSSAHGATPKSPAASTKPIPCWWTARKVRNAASGPSVTFVCSI